MLVVAVWLGASRDSDSLAPHAISAWGATRLLPGVLLRDRDPGDREGENQIVGIHLIEL